ncbi:MAG TPA: glycosyltransferase [Gaiellaceae bacterium]|nr:glycosyltransferase [Gaiellaceae bacterium]
MRVLHVSQPTEAGVALVVRQLAADQVRRGYDVRVACPQAGPLAGEVGEAGAEHHDWPARRAPGLSVAGETIRLRRIIEAVDPDVVHLHSSKAGLAGRLVLRGRLPTVFEPNGWSFLVGGPVGAAALRWERLADRWCDAIISVSEGEREVGERSGVAGRFVLIPNALDLEVFTPVSEGDRRAARLQLGLPDEPLAVCVGRLSRQKGQDVLLRAWPRVAAEVPQAGLVLVGDGPDAEALAAQGVAGVRLAGHREDVPAWLAAADVVALPSRWEGLSLVMLQAMARGRSVVSADVAGARDSLSEGAGAIVPIEDDVALANALVERLRDPALAAAEGEAGRRVVVERHDVRRMGEAVAALYTEVLARS